MIRDVAIVAAVRTPWCRRGGALASLGAGELGAVAVREVMLSAGIRPKVVDALVLGAAAPPRTAGDVAREVGLRAELGCSAHAVSMGSISGERAVCTAVDAIAMGRADLVVAAGVETPSDVAVSMTRPLREAITEARRASGVSEKVRALAGLDRTDLKLSFPRESDPVAGMSPVSGAELLAKQFDFDRSGQDRYAARSHAKALDAARRGRRGGTVVPVPVPGSLAVEIVEMDDGPRADADPKRLSTLPTLKVDGDASVVTERLATVTAGNAASEFDGAAALLLTSVERAKAEGWTIAARIVDHRFVAVDPYQRPLLGAVDSLKTLMKARKRSVDDLGVIELHEPFAVSVLATIAALSLDPDRVNANGGSLAFGHPAGATGIRLVATALERMKDDEVGVAAVASSGDGGQGCAMLLER
jgi:acetyl-CoA acyltransferase